jgi:hypothetical protein
MKHEQLHHISFLLKAHICFHTFPFLFSFCLFLYFNCVIFLLVSQISQTVHQGLSHCYPLWPSTTVNTKMCILQPLIPFGYIWAAWPENEGMVMFQNVRSYSPIDKTSCPRRLESSTCHATGWSTLNCVFIDFCVYSVVGNLRLGTYARNVM